MIILQKTSHQPKILQFLNCILNSNLLIHYAPYLGIFVFPNKNDIYIWDSFIMIKEDLLLHLMILFQKIYLVSNFVVKYIIHLQVKKMVFQIQKYIKKILFPNWKLEIGRQLLDILTKVRTIFSDKQYFEIENSVNAEAAQLFKENAEEYLQKTLECAKKSREEFNNLPQDCPYRFESVKEIPAEVKIILENAKMSKIEKKKELRKIIEEMAKNKQQKNQIQDK